LDASDQLGGLLLHDDRVLVQQRLTLRAISNDRVSLCRQFDVRREASAARADHTGLFYFVN
jgi:hypothetical protein